MNIKRFDMKKKPKRQMLRPLIWALTLPAVKKYKLKLEKIGMENIKPPYVLLQNHNAFLDFKVLTKAVFPNRCNYIIAIDGFIKREGLLRRVGGICKRKFINDLTLIKHIKQVIKNKDIIVIYPEARYSLCGTNSDIPDAVGKLIKMLKVPLVTLISHGHHIDSPFYNSHPRHIKGIESTMKCLVNNDEIENITVDEINQRIKNEFIYDDYKWQKDNNILIPTDNRAIGLEKVLYQCPVCHTEYQMVSDDNTLTCNHCHSFWFVNKLSVLESPSNTFTHIPDWYNWERENVRKEIENNNYFFQDDVEIKSLPNSKGFIDKGKGVLTHTMDGIHLQGEDLDIQWFAKDNYSVHIEYNYLFKYGDCVDLNTLDDTFYVYPKGSNFSVTKISLAVEELYKYYNKRSK